MAVAFLGWRTDSNEHNVRAFHRLSQVGGERQAPGGDVLLDQGIEPRLVDRHDPLEQAFNLAGVLVDTDHVGAEF